MRSRTLGLAVLAMFATAVGGAWAGWLPKLADVSLPTVSECIAFVDHAQQKLAQLITQGSLRSPEMMFGLTVALMLPLLAAVVALGRAALRRNQHRRRLHRSNTLASRVPAPGSPNQVWLEFDDTGRQRSLDPRRELFRVGRDSDNEVALEHKSIEQVHALIRRTPDCRYQIFDVSGNDGHGITINGEAKSSAALSDGDRIGLGNFAVTFRRNGGERAASTAPMIAAAVLRPPRAN